MKELNVDCMKYRKSSHIAGVDVDRMIYETGSCILTIKEAYYSKSEMINNRKVGVNMNGKIIDGYYIEFFEDVKPMSVNSTNRKIISYLIKLKLKCSSSESRMLPNWIGSKIELYFDSDVIMKGEKTGGIRVKTESPIIKIDDKKAIEILNTSKTKSELQENWLKLSKDEKAFPTINALKDKLKTTLK
tara:strand:- start:461 stop:1024 length:564 start_codon:yes stop_codon:yes gene_type:complete